ncbi:carbonic anhydrase [Xylogone sp. PMI_703]|nr:carbonic anhydrase [Xylogone sp. PMI_703]
MNHSHFAERVSLGLSPPKTFIVTCIDARVVPEMFFDLNYGEALVHRNAGGYVRKAVSDILALDLLLLNLDNLFVIHHTDCSTTHFQGTKIRAIFTARVPEQEKDIQGMEFGTIRDLEGSIKNDISFVKQNVLIREGLRNNARGFLFDVKMGKLKLVV